MLYKKHNVVILSWKTYRYWVKYINKIDLLDKYSYVNIKIKINTMLLKN
jgi:hypothetical protein